MISVAVLLAFFALFAMMILGNKNQSYPWILASVILFPQCVSFTQSPQISPQQAFLYGFFGLAVLRNSSALVDGVIKHPLRIPLFLLMMSLAGTAVLNGDGSKGLYNAFRYFMESYAYLIVAYMGGLYFKEIKIEEKWFYPVAVICVLGVIEFVLRTNYIFPLICKAFPNYDGFYDLNSAVSASRSYRNRIFVTTIHPSAFGCMMSCALMMFTGCMKRIPWPRNKVWFVWGALFLLVCLSGSRTALACSLLGLLLFFLGKVNVKIKFLAVVVLAFAVANFAHKFVEEFSVEGQGSSISMRQEQLLFSYVHFMNSPIYGNGVRYTSKTVMERDAYNDRVTDKEIGGLESVIFFQLIDYGLCGISSYFLLFLFAFFYFFRRRRFDYGQGGMLVTVVFFVSACMSGEIGGNNVFAYMLMGYCMGACRVEEDDEMREESLSGESQKITEEEAVSE